MSWRRPLLVPLALIAVGLLLLAANLGLASAEVWRTIGQLWPLVLVLLGVELVLTGRASWGAGLVLIVALVVAGALANGRPFGGPFRGSFPGPAGPFPIQGAGLDQGLDGAREAEVTIRFGAGRLNMGGGAADGRLAQGSIDADSSDALRSNYRVRDGVGVLDVNIGRRGPGALVSDRLATQADLRLSRTVLIRQLNVRTGAAEVDIDLRDLQVADLEVETGASKTTVQLPSRGSVAATIQGGASSILVTVPDAMEADIRVEGGVTQVSVDQTRFPQVHRTGIPGLGFQSQFRSANFDGSTDRVTLRVQTGASSVRVN
jgi:hypothetical protein